MNAWKRLMYRSFVWQSNTRVYNYILERFIKSETDRKEYKHMMNELAKVMYA